MQNIATCLDKVKVPGTKRIDVSKVRGHLRNLVEEAMLQSGMKGKFVKRPWKGGPAVTFEFVSGDPEFLYISIDLAIGIELPHWPPGARPHPAGVKRAKNTACTQRSRPRTPRFGKFPLLKWRRPS